jgi:hypothetical protein
MRGYQTAILFLKEGTTTDLVKTGEGLPDIKTGNRDLGLDGVTEVILLEDELDGTIVGSFVWVKNVMSVGMLLKVLWSGLVPGLHCEQIVKLNEKMKIQD